MDEAEFEREALRLAALGDVEAKRLLLMLATDALRRGIPLSAGLAGFLADGLLQIQRAADLWPGDPLKPEDALSYFGFERKQRHRMASPGRTDEALSLAAAVHLLTAPSGSKTAAVDLVAAAVPCDPMTVWRKCSGIDWKGYSSDPARLMAAPLLAKVAVAVARDPLNHSQEVREFLSVT